MKTWFVTIIAAAMLFPVQGDEAFARGLTKQETAAAGLYVRCPKDEAASCEQAKSAVKKLHGADIAPQKFEKQMAHYETLNLSSASADGKPIATITLPGGKRLNLLAWAVKGDALTISGKGLKAARTFTMQGATLSGPDGLFIRA